MQPEPCACSPPVSVPGNAHRCICRTKSKDQHLRKPGITHLCDLSKHCFYVLQKCNFFIFLISLYICLYKTIQSSLPKKAESSESETYCGKFTLIDSLDIFTYLYYFLCISTPKSLEIFSEHFFLS